MTWLFDGEGVEWSDLAKLKSLENERKMLRKIGRSGVGQPHTPGKLVKNSQCPHCGGPLPANAATKKFEFCMHCRNKLLWKRESTRVSCQHCTRVNEIAADMLGKRVKCMGCGDFYIAGGRSLSQRQQPTALPKFSELSVPQVWGVLIGSFVAVYVLFLP